MDPLELAIGVCLVAMSALLALAGPFGALLGPLVAVVLLVPACVFIYIGLSDVGRRQAPVAKDRTEPISIPSAGSKGEPVPQPAKALEVPLYQPVISPQVPQNQSTGITHAPITELIVHKVIEEDQATFFQGVLRQPLSASRDPQPTVSWVDGLAIKTVSFPQTSETIAESLAGKVHYQTVVFTRVPFQNEVTFKMGEEQFRVKLVRADNDPNLVSLATFLKSNSKSANEPSETTGQASRQKDAKFRYHYLLDAPRK